MKILAPQISCILEPSDLYEQDGKDALNRAYEEGYRQIYVTTATGIMKYHFLAAGKDGRPRYVLLPASSVPGVSIPKLDPVVDFLPDGKVPMRLLDEVKAFFSEVIKQKGQNLEAMIWIVWNQEKGYHLVVPTQTVGGASARYDWSSLPAGCSIIVDIHSHANFGAFFSGTDNADDVGGIRFSGVIGHNVKPPEERDMVFRFNYYGERIDTKVEDLFTKEPPPVPEIPAEWIDKVEIHTYSGPAYNGYQGMHSGNFQNWHRSPNGPGGNFGTNNTHQSRASGHSQSSLDLPSGQMSGSGANAQSDAPFRLEYMVRMSEDQFEALISDMPKKTRNHYRRMRDAELLRRGQHTKNSRSSRAQNKGGSNSGNVTEGGDEVGDFASFPDSEHDALNGFENFQGVIQVGSHVEDMVEDAGTIQVAKGVYESDRGETNSKFDATDLTPDYDVLCVNRGVEVANAILSVDASILALSEAPDLFPRVVSDMFGAMNPEDKLRTLRQLAESLPEEAKRDLETNGL